MANREGKALSFVRVPSNYAAGIQEGEPTPVYIFPDDGSGIPLIDPATAGNLVVQTADGELVDAGYAADVNATAGSVVRRDTGGQVYLSHNGVDSTLEVEATNSSGVGITCVGEWLSAIFVSVNGVSHVEFGTVSAIARTTGALTFRGADAATNRNAQLTELFASIPTSDPLVAGQLWSNGGIVTISAG